MTRDQAVAVIRAAQRSDDAYTIRVLAVAAVVALLLLAAVTL